MLAYSTVQKAIPAKISARASKRALSMNGVALSYESSFGVTFGSSIVFLGRIVINPTAINGGTTIYLRLQCRVLCRLRTDARTSGE